jgi:hypothetical protein
MSTFFGRHLRTGLAALVSGCALVTTVAATPALACVRASGCGLFPAPDAMIKLVGYNRIGDNVYTTDASGQTFDQQPRRFLDGQVRTFYVYFQNDQPTISDSFTIHGFGAATPGYDVRYQRPSGTDITAAVNAETFSTPVLAPGQTYAIRVKVTVGPSAAHGSEFYWVIQQISNFDSGYEDSVAFYLRRL